MANAAIGTWHPPFQGLQHGALGIDRGCSRRVVEKIDQLVGRGVVDTALQPQSALADRRQAELRIKILSDLVGKTEAVHPGCRQHDSIEIVFLELGDPGLDIATDIDHLQIGAEPQQLRLAS